MKSSVAKVAEEHFVLVLRLVTSHTLLTISTLPLVAGDELGREIFSKSRQTRRD